MLDGKGSVDVALEKQGRTIACEISITSTVDQEAKNALKCLDAGFDQVVLIFHDQRQLTKCRDRISERLGEVAAGKVHYLLPEEVYPFLNALEAAAAMREETVRGYRVKTTFRPLDPVELESSRRAIYEAVINSARRKKEQ